MSPLTTRAALAKALHDSTVPVCPHWATGSVCERQADALIASGAVIDAATLADDMPLKERVLDASEGLAGCGAERVSPYTIPLVLRALAAVLDEREVSA